MASGKIIDIVVFGLEIGKLGYDVDQQKSYFQYNPDFLESEKYSKLFPFGNIIFQEWLTARGIKKVTPLEQLAYVANRGMGALEYIDEVITILEKVLKLKEGTTGKDLSELSLLNIFKIGTSAGGARPKILISEHKETGEIIAGDRETSNYYNHYLVKLHIDNNDGYNKEKVEYAYYLLAQEVGIEMMPSKLIENKHFATQRYDRQHGEKQHVLTVTGLTGWDFKSQPENSSYENIFKVALALEAPHKDVQQLFKRMVFNLIFRNVDDHLKNHSFMYNKDKNSWNLAPAYDLTYALNPLFTFKTTSRALSINGKRTDITLKDVLSIAEEFARWIEVAEALEVPQKIREQIYKDFEVLE